MWSFPSLSLATSFILERISGVTTTYGPTARPQAAPFPAVPYRTAASYTGAYLDELAQAAATIDPHSLDRATDVLLDAYTHGRLVFSCGNGGSAAVANHLQCDHLKGVRSGTDLQSRVISLSSNIELLTAIANDWAITTPSPISSAPSPSQGTS